MDIRRSVILCSVSMAVGCSTSVELQYAKPAAPANFTEIEKQANDQYQYVELGTQYVRVAPAEAAAKDAKGNPAAAGASTSQSNSGSSSDSSDSTQPKKVPHDAAGSAATGKKTNAGAKATNPAGTKATNAAGTKTTNPGDTKKTTPPTTPQPDPKASTESPKSLDPALATALIDGKKWAATTIPVPDPTHSFMVRGISGFWQKTSISIARYENSELTSSVTSKAENLVAKRLGQFAGAAASMVSIAKDVGLGVDSAGKAAAAPLLPFSIRVPDSLSPKRIGDLNNGWSYRFDYDTDALPPGTVDFDAFMSGVDGKKVGYWPVLACRTATLTVFPPDKDTLGHKFVFNVVVATTDAIRLQPVPVDGKLSPGTVCSSSETGTASADPVQTAADDLTALQQGIEKVQAAKKGGANSSTSNSSSSNSSASDPTSTAPKSKP